MEVGACRRMSKCVRAARRVAGVILVVTWQAPVALLAQPAQLTCSAGQTQCPGGAGSPPVCRNLATDPNHCGGCAHACGAGQACVAGTCTGQQTATPQPGQSSRQYVCLFNNGPKNTQFLVMTAANPPAVGAPCNDNQGSSGTVAMVQPAAPREYVCQFTSGPQNGQFAILTSPNPPAPGAPCSDGKGNSGKVLADAGTPAQQPTPPASGPAVAKINVVICLGNGVYGPVDNPAALPAGAPCQVKGSGVTATNANGKVTHLAQAFVNAVGNFNPQQAGGLCSYTTVGLIGVPGQSTSSVGAACVPINGDTSGKVIALHR
jgi:hypothetical protein